jgi:hypothetical protein
MRKLGADLAPVEAIVPQIADGALALESPAELTKGASPEDGIVRGVESLVDNETAVVDEAVAVYGIENIRIHVHRICGDDDPA